MHAHATQLAEAKTVANEKITLVKVCVTAKVDEAKGLVDSKFTEAKAVADDKYTMAQAKVTEMKVQSSEVMEQTKAVVMKVRVVAVDAAAQIKEEGICASAAKATDVAKEQVRLAVSECEGKTTE